MKVYVWFVVSLLLCLTLSGCATSGGKLSTSKEQMFAGSDEATGVYGLRQLVVADNSTGRTLMWFSREKAPYEVEIQVVGSEISEFSKAQDVTFTEKETQSTYVQYKVQLAGLKPATHYQYRVNTPQEKGAWHDLLTDAGRGFKALLFPDTQSSDYSFWQDLAKEAYKRNKDAKLSITMGDQVDNGQHAWQWQEWFKGISPLAADIPLSTMLGNHEAYSLKWEACLPATYLGLFSYPANGTPKYQNYYYSFDYGPVHFVVLDTNYSKETKEFLPDFLREQLAWLHQDLARTTAKWKVILMHRDILLYAFGPNSGRERTFETHYTDIARDFMPVFEQYGVDAVLTGHLHTYRRRIPLRNFRPDDKGITYILTGIAGDVRYPNLFATWEHDAARAPQPETANYMTLEVTEHELTFRAYLPNGKEFDQVVLRK